MSNGLLTGLTESWNAHTSKAMIGQKTGLNTGTDAALTYVVNAGMPTGHSLKHSTAAEIFLETAASALVGSIGLTDFLIVLWGAMSALADAGPLINVGEFGGGGGNNGADIGISQGASLNPYAEIPGLDGQYVCNVSPGNNPFTLGSPSMMAMWYKTANHTLYASGNGIPPATIVNVTGIGPLDNTNTVRFAFGNLSVGFTEIAVAHLWQGTGGVENAVAQLASLYSGKMQYSDFDNTAPSFRIPISLEAPVYTHTNAASGIYQ